MIPEVKEENTDVVTEENRSIELLQFLHCQAAGEEPQKLLTHCRGVHSLYSLRQIKALSPIDSLNSIED